MPSVGTASAGLAAVTKTTTWTSTPGSFVSADATSAGFTVTLPASPGNGVTVGVKKIDTTGNVVTVISGTSATIDNDTSVTLTAYGVGAIFVFDGTNWQIYSTAVTNAAALGTAGSTSDAMFTPAYTSGYWYDRRTGTGAVSGPATSIAPSPGTIYYASQYLHRAVSISTVALGVVGTAATSGAKVRIGIFKGDGANGLPSTFLSGSDLGLLTLGTSTNTIYTLTLGSAYSLPKGHFWWGLAFNSTTPGAISSLAFNFTPTTPSQGWDNTNFTSANTQAGPAEAHYVVTSSDYSAGFPTTAVGMQAIWGNNIAFPNVYFRIA